MIAVVHDVSCLSKVLGCASKMLPLATQCKCTLQWPVVLLSREHNVQ